MNEIMCEENQLCESMKYEHKELLYINIKYPEFKPSDEYTFINTFYKSLADKHYEYATTTYYNGVVSRYEACDDPRKRFRYKPESICMNFKVTIMNDRFISLYIDNLLHAHHTVVTHKRYSQTWSNNIIYSLNTLFHNDKRFKPYDKTDFYLTDEKLILFNKAIEELSIPLDELKFRNIYKS